MMVVAMIERFKAGRNLPWSQDFVESRLKTNIRPVSRPCLRQWCDRCEGKGQQCCPIFGGKGKLVLRPLSSRPRFGDLGMFSRGHYRVNRSLPVLSQPVIVEGIS